MATKCRHCASSNYGNGCVKSPTHIHEHIEDDSKCEYCGSPSYGRGCPLSPTKIHRHGHGDDKCIWCGSNKVPFPGYCSLSPDKTHEK